MKTFININLSTVNEQKYCKDHQYSAFVRQIEQMVEGEDTEITINNNNFIFQ